KGRLPHRRQLPLSRTRHGHAPRRRIKTCSAASRSASVEGGEIVNLRMVGCSHHTAAVEVREKLAFSREQAAEALSRFRSRYPEAEAVLLSTCNRVELYFASEAAEACPTHQDAVAFLAEFHGLNVDQVFRSEEHTSE